MSPTKPKRILIFADAGPLVGGGHVMRCLTLARALSERGAECAFVESRAAAPILHRFGWQAHGLPPAIEADDLAGLVAFADEAAERFGADAIVLDHYGVGIAEEDALRINGRRLVLIDDLAHRKHRADLLVDPGFGRRLEHYDGLVPWGCVKLVGPSHALVRAEFAQARNRALSRRAGHSPVRRALVALGLTDVGGITALVVATLAERLGEVRLDIVIGSGAESLPALEAMVQADRRLHLWIDSAEMASLMADADIAIGAGGSSVWERATVGLPLATVILADNQRPMAEAMAAADLTLAIDAGAPDFEAQLGDAWDALARDAALRWRLTERSAELCDGQGAERVAEAVLGL